MHTHSHYCQCKQLKPSTSHPVLNTTSAHTHSHYYQCKQLQPSTSHPVLNTTSAHTHSYYYQCKQLKTEHLTPSALLHIFTSDLEQRHTRRSNNKLSVQLYKYTITPPTRSNAIPGAVSAMKSQSDDNNNNNNRPRTSNPVHNHGGHEHTNTLYAHSLPSSLVGGEDRLTKRKSCSANN